MFVIEESGRMTWNGFYLGYIIYDAYARAWYRYHGAQSGPTFPSRDEVIEWMINLYPSMNA